MYHSICPPYNISKNIKKGIHRKSPEFICFFCGYLSLYQKLYLDVEIKLKKPFLPLHETAHKNNRLSQ